MIHDIFPFQQLNDLEFRHMIDNPSRRIKNILNENNFKRFVHDTLESGMNKTVDCNYYTEESMSDLLKMNKNAFTMLNLNIRSLDRHFCEFVALLYNLDHPIDVITLTEIGRKNVANRINMLSDRYNCEYILPKSKKCGGSCILVRKNFKYHVRNDLRLSFDETEDVWLDLEVNDQKVIVGSVYRHPGTNLNEFQNEFEKTLQNIDKECCHSFIGGDFNLDGLKIETHRKTAEFYECLMTLNFIPTITLPTRITETTMTLIDNVFMKINENNVNSIMISGNLYSDISDHLPNFVILRNAKYKSIECTRPKVRIFGEKNMSNFMNAFNTSEWNDFFNTTDVNGLLSLFYEKFNTLFEQSFPLRTLSRKRSKDKIWLTTGLKTAIRQKSELYRKFLNHPSQQNKTLYTKYKNILTSLLRQAETNHYLEKIENKKKNIRALWQIYGPIINPGKNKQPTKIEKIVSGNRILTSKKTIANALNDHFVNIGPKLLKHSMKSNNFESYLKYDQNNSFFLHPTDPSEIQVIISNQDSNKTPGDDEITGKLLKKCPAMFSKLISHIVNTAIDSGKYPEKLKLGKVIPIYKKGDKYDPTNYRPINLLSTINKIIEKVLYKRLYDYFEKNNIIYKYQFGFRHSYSTTMALIEITDQIREQLENKNITIGIYIDLTKAFDLVNHKILISKLQTYGIRGPAIELIKSYLSDRYQYTKVDSAKSDVSKIQCGVPQGSVLGPLFFLMFVNDMQYCTNAQLRLFADDTNIFISNKDPSIIKQQAEECLNDITKWLQANELLLSEDKTKFSIFVPCKKKIPHILNEIKVNGRIVQRTDSCKYLGVVLDDKLSFDKHINQLSKDLIKVICAFKIVKHWVPNEHKMKLYYAYFHSKLQYGIEIYGTSANKHIKKIEVLQHKAIKALFNLDPLTPSAYLYHKFKVLPAKDIYSCKIAKFIFNQIHGDQNNVFSSFFSSIAQCHDNYPNTRNRNKLHIKRVNTVNGSKMVKIRGAEIWNSLTDVFKQDLMNLSHFQFNKMIKDFYLDKYAGV